MNGFVKSPWKWNEIFDMCAKFFLAKSREDRRLGVDIRVPFDIDLAEELYYLSATESEDIYLNSKLIKVYSDIVGIVQRYEELNGEITA